MPLDVLCLQNAEAAAAYDELSYVPNRSVPGAMSLARSTAFDRELTDDADTQPSVETDDSVCKCVSMIVGIGVGAFVIMTLTNRRDACHLLYQ